MQLRSLITAAVLPACCGTAVGFFSGDGTLPVPTTLEDFFLLGTQPDPGGAVL